MRPTKVAHGKTSRFPINISITGKISLRWWNRSKACGMGNSKLSVPPIFVLREHHHKFNQHIQPLTAQDRVRKSLRRGNWCYVEGTRHLALLNETSLTCLIPTQNGWKRTFFRRLEEVRFRHSGTLVSVTNNAWVHILSKGHSNPFDTGC